MGSDTNFLEEKTTKANSAISLSQNRQAIVELSPEHPGFQDQAYRERRNYIAQIAVDFVPGSVVPEAPYVEEEHEVWRKVWEGLKPAHKKYACQEYLEYVEKLQFDESQIPQLSDVSKKVKDLSGFCLEPVGGLVHPKVFLSTLGQGTFLSTQYIRHHSTPLYTPEPDVVHEIIGHAGLLACPALANLNRLVGEAAKRTDEKDEERIECLGRIYWYTIEFGVLREQGKIKAYGAGLLSSYGELEAMESANIRPFDFEEMMSLPYDVTIYQPTLFCADSFDLMERELSKFLIDWK